jgi:hypothetical protein
MAFKDIIVHQGDDVHAGQRLTAAIALTRRFSRRI